MLSKNCLVLGRLALGNGFITDDELEWALGRCASLEVKEGKADMLRVLQEAERITPEQAGLLKTSADRLHEQAEAADAALAKRLKAVGGFDLRRIRPKPTQQDLFFCKVAVMNKLLKREAAEHALREITLRKEYQDVASILRELKLMSDPAVEIAFKVWGAWKKKIETEKKLLREIRAEAGLPAKAPAAKPAQKLNQQDQAKQAEQEIKRLIMDLIRTQDHMKLFMVCAEKKRGLINITRLAEQLTLRRKRAQEIFEDFVKVGFLSPESEDMYRIQAAAFEQPEAKTLLNFAENENTRQVLNRWILAFGEET